MSDSLKIYSGLFIFLVLVTSPFWYNLAGNKSEKPKPEIITKHKQCVEDANYMKVNHMTLLNIWRDSVVREGKRIHVSSYNNQEYYISLSSMQHQKSCIGCHTNKAQFCDRCHNYTGVSRLDCWDCHYEPGRF